PPPPPSPSPTRRSSDLSPLPLERWEIPAQLRGIAHHLLRRDLEEHDKAGLVELACPAIDELDPHGGLACPDGPFNQSDVASRDADRKSTRLNSSHQIIS